jgi:hypothetical protein
MRTLRAMLTDLREAAEFYTVPKKKEWLDPKEVARGLWKSYYQSNDRDAKVMFLADPSGTMDRMPNLKTQVPKAVVHHLLMGYEGEEENQAEVLADVPDGEQRDWAEWGQAKAHHAGELVARGFQVTMEPVTSPKTGVAGYRLKLSMSVAEIERAAEKQAGPKPRAGVED